VNLRPHGALAALAILTAPACEPQNGDPALPQHYADKEAALARFDDPHRDAWAMPDQVVEALAIEATDFTVADIGAGSGYFSRRLAKKVPDGKVYAVDVDTDFKRHIETHRDEWGTPNIEPRLAVYENPLLPAGAVDLVFVSNTYAYIRDRVTYFKAVHGALTDRGRLAVIDFRQDASCDGIDTCPAPSQRVGKEDALRELGEAGFVVEAEHDFLPHQYFLVLKKAP
jgi:SAM-dependent methyltransferase